MSNRIQPFAALIAVTSDWVITHISENIGAFLDIDNSVLGHTLLDTAADFDGRYRL